MATISTSRVDSEPIVCPGASQLTDRVGVAFVATDAALDERGEILACEYKAGGTGERFNLSLSVYKSKAAGLQRSYDLFCRKELDGEDVSAEDDSDATVLWEDSIEPTGNGCAFGEVKEMSIGGTVQTDGFVIVLQRTGDEFMCSSFVTAELAQVAAVEAAFDFSVETIPDMCRDENRLEALAQGSEPFAEFDCASYPRPAIEAALENLEVGGIIDFVYEGEPIEEGFYTAGDGCADYFYDASSPKTIQPGVNVFVGVGRTDTTPDNMADRCGAVNRCTPGPSDYVYADDRVARAVFCWNTGTSPLQIARTEGRFSDFRLTESDLAAACRAVLTATFG